MIFAPYRNVLDFGQDLNGSPAQSQLAWDDIDYELGGRWVGRVRTLVCTIRRPGWHPRIDVVRGALSMGRAKQVAESGQ